MSCHPPTHTRHPTHTHTHPHPRPRPPTPTHAHPTTHPSTPTRARARAQTHASTRTHARTHARTHKHTTNSFICLLLFLLPSRALSFPVTRPSPPPSRHLRQAPSQADRRARAPCPADPGRLPQTCIGRPTRAAAGRRSGEQGGEAAGVFGHRASRKTRGVTICDPLPALSSLYKPSWPPSASLADSCCLMQPLYPPRPSRSAPVMLRRTEVSLATPDRAC